jgi:hypothetical protein
VALKFGDSTAEPATVRATLSAEMPRVDLNKLGNKRQAFVPKGSTVLPNPNGTAPGLWIERSKYGETVFLLEPNVKRSRGGLRDLQLIRWIGFIRAGTGGVSDVVLAARDGSTERTVPVFGTAAIAFDPVGDRIAAIGPTEKPQTAFDVPLGPLRVLDAKSGKTLWTFRGNQPWRGCPMSFMLNGRPYMLRMVLDQGYWPDTRLAAPSDDALRRDVELAKAMGFNGVRKHQKIEDPRYLYWADKLGLLVWEEMPSAYRFTTAAIPSTTWLSAANAPREHGWRSRATTASAAINNGRIMALNFLDQVQNADQLAVDSISTNAREFAPHKYKIAAPGEH